MSSASDLLDHFKLDAEVFPEYTLHTSYRANRTRGLRKEKVEARWDRQRSIGQGSFGEVWLEVKFQGTGAATDERAVKIINKSQMSTFKIDYRREISALATFSKSQHLQEEVLVKFLGWYESAKVVYLAMEYFENGDLGQYLTDTFTETDVKQITSNLLEGLKIIHAEGFTHRDLKPANIFVVQKPPAFPMWWVKLGDFGITKRLDNEETALRTRIGTRNFQAPEIIGCIQDEEDDSFEYTNAVDMWSLGCVIYNLMTQRAPFTVLRSLQRYCDGRVSFPEEALRGRLSIDGIEFVKTLLSPSPSKRLTAEKASESLWLQSKNESTEPSSEIPIRGVQTNGATSKEAPQVTNPAIELVRVTEVDKEKIVKSSLLSIMGNPNSSLPSRQKLPVFSSKASVPDIDPIFEMKSTGLFQERIPQRVPDDGSLHIKHDDPGEPQRQPENTYDTPCVYQSTELHSPRQLLEGAGFHVHSEAYEPSKAMSWALSKENLHITRFLLSEGGANVEMKLPSRLSVLQRAAEMGHEATVRLLLEMGADVNAKGGLGVTPLYIASTCGHASVVRLLYDKNADIDARNTIRGFTALQEAIKDRNETMVDLLVSLGANVKVIDGLGITPLYYATVRGLAPVVRLLVGKKANVNAVNTERSLTALQYAIEDDDETMVDLLVSLGADIGLRTSSGSTALHLVALRGNERMLMRVLQWKVCDIDGRNRRKETALLIAARAGHDILVKRLLEQGASFRMKNSVHNTALHEALQGRHAKNNRLTVQYLLGWGASPNVEGEGQKTALHLAAIVGDVYIVRQLLGAGADILIKDGNGKRALETLPEDASEELKRLLTWLPTYPVP